MMKSYYHILFAPFLVLVGCLRSGDDITVSKHLPGEERSEEPDQGSEVDGATMIADAELGGETLAGAELGGESCTPQNSTQCFDNQLYWMDSCGNRGDLLESCAEGTVCVDGDLECRVEQINTAPCASSPAGCPNLTWVRIQGGDFMMGDHTESPNQYLTPLHEVSVQSFEMTRSEITAGQYRHCVDAEVCTEPGNHNHLCNWSFEVGTKEDHALGCLTWHQAMVFAAWVGARLPTEAEWEYAVRNQGAVTTYPWGEESPCNRTAMLGSAANCDSDNLPVCSRPDNYTTQGLCDMVGNMWEWTQDENHGNYIGAPNDGRGWCAEECPQNAYSINYDPDLSNSRILRGGSWGDNISAYYVFHRMAQETDYQNTSGGRLVKLQ